MDEITNKETFLDIVKQLIPNNKLSLFTGSLTIKDPNGSDLEYNFVNNLLVSVSYSFGNESNHTSLLKNLEQAIAEATIRS